MSVVPHGANDVVYCIVRIKANVRSRISRSKDLTPYSKLSTHGNNIKPTQDDIELVWAVLLAVLFLRKLKYVHFIVLDTAHKRIIRLAKIYNYLMYRLAPFFLLHQ